MENNHNIDQQFNEASKLSEEPTVFPGFEKVWTAVEEKLDKKEEKKKSIPFWLPYGIAASLLIGLGTFYFLDKNDKTEPVQPAITGNDKNSMPAEQVKKIDSTIKYHLQDKTISPSVPVIAYEPASVTIKEPLSFSSKPVLPEVQENSSGDEKMLHEDTLKRQNIEEVAMVAPRMSIRKETVVTNASTMLIASTDKEVMRPSASVAPLRGSIAGIETSSATRGKEEIRIRGAAGIDGRFTGPLYVIDGIPVGQKGGVLSMLESEKIKEVKVIKGTEAAALYGSRAHNGVVIITTTGLSQSEVEVLKKMASESSGETIKEPEEPEKELPEAGQLTAGEVNDFSKWDYWKDIAAPSLDLYKQTWKLFPDRRASVQLVNKDGKPVAGESLTLLDDRKNVIWESVSDNLGNAELWIGAMMNENLLKMKPRKYYIADETGQIISTNVKEFKNGQNLIVLNRPCLEKRTLDLAFVVDATGSMGDEISYLQSELLDVLKKVESKLKGTKVRYGSVFYRDQGDEYVTRKFDFSDNAEELVSFIKKQKAAGGGDTPEAVTEALQISIDELKWSSENSTKIMFLILDAPPHQSEENTKKLYDKIKMAAQKGITIIPLAASDTDKETEYLMRTFALLTNGTYTFLTNDSGIGNHHIKPSADSYEVEKLNDLLLRLILQRATLPKCGPGISNENINKKMETEIHNQKNTQTVVFPNPTKGPLQIKTKNRIEELFVYDVAGKIIMRRENLEADKNTIDLTSYPQGVYLVRVKTNAEWETFKIIKN
ncbi:T9SS type A sorting domain-containing protein [Chryseobacterium sp. P1-3]|uniref:T9SS type A sorting domain-containing protein n=1 Tax=Chryseobacterium sp. (strain P1-3) TaxID=1517683 RepID=UPI0006792EE3|nr:T9SS type A sorting domain-containing protein [Chryseobacterium sp. P1-3]